MTCPLAGRAHSGRAKIRVGFVSSYLRRHSIGKLFAGIIAKLPRKRFDVVVFSSTSRTDDVTQVRPYRMPDSRTLLCPCVTQVHSI